MRVPCPAAKITTTPARLVLTSHNPNKGNDLSTKAQRLGSSHIKRCEVGGGDSKECTQAAQPRSSCLGGLLRGTSTFRDPRTQTDSSLSPKNRARSLSKTQLDPLTELGLDLGRRKFRLGVFPGHFRSPSLRSGRMQTQGLHSFPTSLTDWTLRPESANRGSESVLIEWANTKKRPPLRSFT
jgi:hypothetical protein